MDDEMRERFDRLEAMFERLASQRMTKEWYSLPEAAKLVGRSAERVRKWCQEGRIEAVKSDRGKCEHGEWRISAAEIDRWRNHGLRPESRRPRGPSPFDRRPATALRSPA